MFQMSSRRIRGRWQTLSRSEANPFRLKTGRVEGPVKKRSQSGEKTRESSEDEVRRDVARSDQGDDDLCAS